MKKLITNLNYQRLIPNRTVLKLGHLLASGSGYTIQDLLIINSVSLLQGQNYTFKIFDSYGDGLCCRLSGGTGNYKIVSNGTTLVSSSNFNNSAEHNFCFSCSPNYSTCTDGIQNGSETGVDCGGTSCVPCVNGSNQGYRRIVFTHGFAGNENTWTKMNQIHNKNNVFTIADWSNRWTDSRTSAYSETSLDVASQGALVQIKNKMTEMTGGNPIDNTGIVIAHSMGGVVVRDMDRKYDQSPNLYGPKPYGGIITFGSPHGGSPIANSIISGAVSNYTTNSCQFLGNQIARFDGPIVGLLDLYLNLAKNTNLPSYVTNTCNGLLDNALFNLVNQRGILTDAQVGSPQMTNLYTAPNIKKIALIGIEDQPVSLRYASSFSSGNSAYFFQDNDDTDRITDVNTIAIKLDMAMGSSLNPFNYNENTALKNLRDKVLNLNRDIMSLTGAIVSNPLFTGQCQVDAYHYGNLQSSQILSASTAQGCDQYNYSPGGFGSYYDVISTPLYNPGTPITTPHDGLIPAYSAEAWPGATKLIMNGSNHSQMKNDSNTKDVLKRIYNATDPIINSWWQIAIK